MIEQSRLNEFRNSVKVYDKTHKDIPDDVNLFLDYIIELVDDYEELMERIENIRDSFSETERMFDEL